MSLYFLRHTVIAWQNNYLLSKRYTCYLPDTLLLYYLKTVANLYIYTVSLTQILIIVCFAGTLLIALDWFYNFFVCMEKKWKESNKRHWYR